MTNSTISKKTLSDYKLEDIKILFINIKKKLTSKIILLEIGDKYINISIAKNNRNRLLIKKVFSQSIPDDALEKSVPTDLTLFSQLVIDTLNQLNIHSNRIAICIPSDACYTRIINIPANLSLKEAKEFVGNPNSGLQIPIPIHQTDFDVSLTNLPPEEIDGISFNKYFLTSIPRNTLNTYLDLMNLLDINLSSFQVSHSCIANLLQDELNSLKDNELIISLELLDDFTQFIIMDKSGPVFIKRIASIRKYPTIEEMKEYASSSKTDQKENKYLPLSNLDLKILIREVKDSYNAFILENNIMADPKVFLSGNNSQHKNLREIISENFVDNVKQLKVSNLNIISELDFDPETCYEASLNRLVGLGISLIKPNDYIENINSEQSYDLNINKAKQPSYKIDSDKISIAQFNKSEKEIALPSLKDLDLAEKDNIDIKSSIPKKDKKVEDKKKEDKKKEDKKKEDKKKESDLPGLPNLDLAEKDNIDIKSSIPKKDKKVEDKKKEDKKNKSDLTLDKKENRDFKLDTSFLDLKDD